MERRRDGIFSALDARCARKAWSVLFAIGTDGDGTSHYGDKYKSGSSCVEREFIFFLWVVLVFQAN